MLGLRWDENLDLARDGGGGGDNDMLKKASSIRKRFSTLKLGTRRSKHGLMSGVEEEQQGT